MKIGFLAALAPIVFLSAPVSASAQALQGFNLFEQHCANCHAAKAAADDRTPDRIALSQRTPEAILESITTGAMATNASAMTPAQKRILAEHLTGRPIGAAVAGTASSMKNQCQSKPLGDVASMPMWNGWGVDATNGRFQRAAAAGVTADQVPKLSLKWAFGFPNGTSAWGQPTVAGGRVFVGSDNSFVYALDATTGCVHWSYQATAGVRTAISVGTIGSRRVVYFGDLKANVHAVDAETGAGVWMKRVDPHPLARVTGAPTLVDGRLYVPVASLEEGSGANPNYQCCTFRGNLVALDARTGDQLWKTYVIPEEAKPTRKNAIGVQMWGPSGAAVWSSPTVDVKRGVVYVATGNGYTQPAAAATNAVLGIDMKSGAILWTTQVTEGDAYMVGCGPAAPSKENCPDKNGPDFDFGNSPILRELPNGQAVLVVGQKSGSVWALDPDKKGAILWEKKIGRGTALGGLEWGSAADAEVGYFPVADAQYGPQAAGGMFALKLATADVVWEVKPPGAECTGARAQCTASRSAAISVIPGAVFSGTTDGMMRAYSSVDGKVLWEFNTAREFTTVNGVTAKGGAINGPGPVIAGGIVLTNSGYNYLGTGAAGNVLLAFTVAP